METELILSRYGFDSFHFYESALLYKYRASIGFLLITEDMAEIFDFESCEVAGIC